MKNLQNAERLALLLSKMAPKDQDVIMKLAQVFADKQEVPRPHLALIYGGGK